MSSTLRSAVLARAERNAPHGVAMGTIVDELADAGHEVEAIERTVWDLLGERRLTPSGFVCRMVRRRDRDGEFARARTYEFMLIPWSPDMDRQLDLGLSKADP